MGKKMMRYVSREAFDVLLRLWPLEITNVDELTQAPMVGVELFPPEVVGSVRSQARQSQESSPP